MEYLNKAEQRKGLAYERDVVKKKSLEKKLKQIKEVK